MVDYKKRYDQLFNTLTDALEAPDFDTARQILRQAQTDAEETYLRDTDDEESSPYLPQEPPLRNNRSPG